MTIQLAKELASTSMLLQDVYGLLRQKQNEIDILQNDLQSRLTEIDTLKARVLLFELFGSSKPEAAISNEEYQP